MVVSKTVPVTNVAFDQALKVTDYLFNAASPISLTHFQVFLGLNCLTEIQFFGSEGKLHFALHYHKYGYKYVNTHTGLSLVAGECCLAVSYLLLFISFSVLCFTSFTAVPK